MEEVQKRTGLKWRQQSQPPAAGPAIVLAAQQSDPQWSAAYPARQGTGLAETRPEGFRIVVTHRASGEPIVWLMGADGPGALYGVGQFLPCSNGTRTRPIFRATSTLHRRRSIRFAGISWDIVQRRTPTTVGAWPNTSSTSATSRFSVATRSRTFLPTRTISRTWVVLWRSRAPKCTAA